MQSKAIYLAIALSLAASAVSAAPWTYRGSLNDDGQPANGSYDLRVTLLNEACWDTSGNAGTNPANEFLGTIDAQPFVLRTRNVQSLRIEPSAILFGGTPNTANIIAGSSANNVTVAVRGATIAGGGLPAGDSDPQLLSEGPNRVTDVFGTISGGYDNQAGDAAGSAVDRAYATVAGGRSNSATDEGSAVGGGSGNAARGKYSVVAGGSINGAGGLRSAVGGGSGNSASGAWSTISGGISNCAGGDYSWAGGSRAKVRPGNEVGDGTCVAHSGDANGDEGSFVWAGSQGTDFITSGPDQFLVRAAGGIGLNTSSIPTNVDAVLQSRAGGNVNVDFYMRTASHGRGINLGVLPRDGAAAEFRIAQFDGNTFTDRLMIQSDGDFFVTEGAFKPGGGSWGIYSDARLKTDITPLTGALDRLLLLKAVEYTYRNPDPAKRPAGRHIGFIAQEVADIFPAWVNADEEGYLTVGPQGFEALTVESLRELQQENTALKASLQALEARLEAIESAR